MDLIKAFTEEQMKKEVPQFSVGDTVRVHNKIVEGTRERIQLFEGTVIAKNGGGIGIFCATGGICAGIAVSNRRKKVNRCQSRNTMLRRCPD